MTDTVASHADLKPATRPAPIQDRALKTRQAVLRAVEEIVAVEGSAALTTTRVAQASGVSVGTIYRYFEDRAALLLCAYDTSVGRIVEHSERALDDLGAATPPAEAAHRLLTAYLDAAARIPAHAGLLGAMRALRPVGADQDGDGLSEVSHRLLRPFLARFVPDAAIDAARLRFMTVLVGTMVDLYLTTSQPADRARLKDEIDAHLDLMIKRLVG